MDSHIRLSPDLIARIEREANARGMSLRDFVRDSLERAITQKPSDDECEPEALRLATAVYDGLSDDDIDEIEQIALDRGNFLNARSAD